MAIAANRMSHAKAGVATIRPRASRTCIAAAVVLATSPRVEPAREKTMEAWRRAEDLINEHGRWARHVAYRCGAISARAQDLAGEVFWSDVISAMREMQTRPST